MYRKRFYGVGFIKCSEELKSHVSLYNYVGPRGASLCTANETNSTSIFLEFYVDQPLDRQTENYSGKKQTQSLISEFVLYQNYSLSLKQWTGNWNGIDDHKACTYHLARSESLVSILSASSGICSG